MNLNNIFDSLPTDLKEEVFEDLVRSDSVRIERIVSMGQSTDWYDQEENEWVMVMQGRAQLELQDGISCDLSAGDYLIIPAHVKHRVAWTDAEQVTIWLAIFYK